MHFLYILFVQALVLLWFWLLLPSRELRELQQTHGSLGLRSDLSASSPQWQLGLCLQAFHSYTAKFLWKITKFFKFVWLQSRTCNVNNCPVPCVCVVGSTRTSWPTWPTWASGCYRNPRTTGNWKRQLDGVVCVCECVYVGGESLLSSIQQLFHQPGLNYTLWDPFSMGVWGAAERQLFDMLCNLMGK